MGMERIDGNTFGRSGMNAEQPESLR
jgi:hypothetical protein